MIDVMEKKRAATLNTFSLTLQRQRERDGGDVLLQEGGPRGDCDALHGASSYRGVFIVTR